MFSRADFLQIHVAVIQGCYKRQGPGISLGDYERGVWLLSKEN